MEIGASVVIPPALVRQPQATQPGGQDSSTNKQQGKPPEVSPNTPSQSQQDQEQLQVLKQVAALSRRDQEVRTHEQIHASLAGPYGGSPQYSYTRGPDGVLYATDGQVSIDISPIPGDPQATYQKMQVVRRAALGPSDPSAADQAVAAKASALAAQAIAELSQIQQMGKEPGEPGDFVSVKA